MSLFSQDGSFSEEATDEVSDLSEKSPEATTLKKSRSISSDDLFSDGGEVPDLSQKSTTIKKSSIRPRKVETPEAAQHRQSCRRFQFPAATIDKIISTCVEGRVSPEARRFVNRAAVLFVMWIADEAQQATKKTRKKTILPAAIQQALTRFGWSYAADGRLPRIE
ncbi:MAG: uncharacterized protein KVP18_002695 [Porospora cf. gigantea A]|uniref:uncharacterized protein n=1 Tax=Porospora cf. gigantea A TaxID=2853593 RepID=UPI00355AA211|nr:MAG: hypothetical protein KVP18_002695 [Porospora cf. gigantea A]